MTRLQERNALSKSSLIKFTDYEELVEAYKNIITGKKIIFEGAQGTFLDLDHGTFPFVTSSNTLLKSNDISSSL